MIRDPSDGSVKPARTPDEARRAMEECDYWNGRKAMSEVPSAMPPIDPVDHVLRAREQRSKQWLAEYRAKQKEAK